MPGNQQPLFDSAPQSGALFSYDRRYRYVLFRIFDPTKPPLVFCGTNPSYADEMRNDPTANRMIGRAIDWGYGSLYMVNIFAWCETHSIKLSRHSRDSDIIGPENDRYIRATAAKARDGGMVLTGWGNAGSMLERGAHVLEILREFGPVHALKINQDGSPQHPLYLAKSVKPIPMETAA
jgi:hypothetical protein